MTNQFDSSTTTDDVLAGIDLHGKKVLITGLSAGLGIETARALAARGASVTGTARNLAKAEKAILPVREAAQSSGSSLELIQLDLADLSSVRKAADQLVAEGHQFDIVIANAGVMATPFGHTKDGFETQFGTNFIGHFVFINRIAPLIRSGGRVVTLSSAAHAISDIDLLDPNFEKADYDQWVAYGRSKTAVALLAVEFDRRYRNWGIRATAVHPGGVKTELQRHYSPEIEAAFIKQINEANEAKGLPPFQWKTIPQGAATTVWAAVVASTDTVGGRYCEDCHVADINDSEGVTNGVRSYALDQERAAALWALGEKLADEHF
jgi:Dehydrogenases with different specificities (related to short-chain alcohol dehydrogenases)